MKFLSIGQAIAIGASHPVNTIYAPNPAGRSWASEHTQRIKRDDPEEARICLTCTRKRCTGSRRCFNQRKRQMTGEGELEKEDVHY